jgi:hypothetical protein
MEEDYTLRILEQAWRPVSNGIDFDEVGLRTVGDGLYLVTAGTGPYRVQSDAILGQAEIAGQRFNILGRRYGSETLQSPDGAVYLRIVRGPGGGAPIPEASPSIPIQ